MKTIALRFADNFAPDIGTICAHQKKIDENGYVWYGKLGNTVSNAILTELLSQEDPRFLLIHSGKSDRYWVHFSDVKKETPAVIEYPNYYGELATKMKTWFRVSRFEVASKDVISKCFVASSGKPLSIASRHSMSPYFIINYVEEE